MYPVPWKDYSEEEIQEILALLFRNQGYDVYNMHKTDRRGEVGADLECTKPGEADKILIGVKKKPQQKDIYQLETLARRDARTKIYVYIEEPSASFKEAMSRTSRISFWDSKKLTLETFSKDLRFYIFLIIENYIEKASYRISFSFCKIYLDIEEGRLTVEEPVKANPEMLSLLWAAKDRSTSLHKSLRTLQDIYENTDLSSLDEKTKESLVYGYLKGLFGLHLNSLRPLEILFRDFIAKYPSNFAQFCIQTKGRSNWIFFFSHFPQLLPNYIMKSLEEAEKESSKLKLLDEKGGGFDFSESVSDLLGDISRIVANGAYWLEDTVDDLLSIALYKEWTGMREKTPKWLRFWEREHGLGYPIRIEPPRTDSEVKRKSDRHAQALQPSEVRLTPKHKLCFVAMPFKMNFYRLYEKLFKPVLEENGFTVMKADDVYKPMPIHEIVKKYIRRASLVLADVTNDVPNVLYELGQAHALGKKTIIITQDEGDIPSDFRHFRYLKYDDDEKGWELLRVQLNKAVGSIR